LIGHLVTEHAVLTVGGGVLGLVAGAWTIQLLVGLIPPDMLFRLPFLSGLRLNGRVIAFASVLTIITTLLVSFAPLSRLSWSSLSRDFAEGSRGSAGTTWRRLEGRLVVVELAVTMMLLTGAGLLGSSFYRLVRVDLGFQPDNVATVQVAAPHVASDENEKVVALVGEITSRITALPGVQSVGISSLLPVKFNGNTDWIRFVGRPYDGGHIEVNQRAVARHAVRNKSVG
jgi:hypothetical protein